MTHIEILKIGFPLATVENVLAKGSPETMTWYNVAHAYDHAEAAHFVREDWDKITLYWEGTEEQLQFLRGFIRSFPAEQPPGRRTP